MKKLISLMVAMVMCLSLVPSAFAAEAVKNPSNFTDVPADAPYWDALYYAQYNGYISGVGGNRFDPDGLVTRGQFVSILCRVLEIQKSQAWAVGNKTDIFDDVNPEKDWFGPYVVYAANQGWVNGVGNRKFAPGNTITFAQMGVMIDNFLRKSGEALPSNPVTYADATTIPAWAKSSMDNMAQLNLIPTDAAGNVRPNQAVTRADATVALVRLAKALGLGEEPPALTGNEAVLAITAEEKSAAVEAKVKAIHDEMWATGQITSSSTEKEKAIAYFKWMNLHCKYDVTTEWYGDAFETGAVHQAYGALIEGLGVCDGLAHAYKLLLDTEGITSKIAVSHPSNAKYGHAWVEAVLDGETLQLNPAEFYQAGKWPNGTVDDLMLATYIEKKFYPREYEESRKDFMGWD